MFDLSSKAADQLLGWANIGLIVGSVLVLLATLGTIWASAVRDQYSEIRQSNNETAVAQATAASKAADARAAEAKRGSSEASLKAAEANERAAQLEKQTAELRKQAEEAKAEAATVKERLHKMQSVRRITKDQLERLSSFLSSDSFRFQPGANIRIFSVPDTESQLYAMDFLALLKASGVNYYPTPEGQYPGECIQINPDANGVVFSVGSLEVKENTQRFAIFANLISNVGIPLTIDIDAKLKDNEATISILRKPVV